MVGLVDVKLTDVPAQIVVADAAAVTVGAACTFIYPDH